MIFSKKAKASILLGIGIFCFLGFLSFLYPYLLFKINTKRFYAPVLKIFGRPGMWVIWVVYFSGILFLFHSKGKKQWRAKGIYLAFVISLFTEMFGWGFIVYLFSPFIKYPVLTQTHIGQNWILPQIAGTYLIAGGMMLIIIGWKAVYNSQGLVTSGIYKFIRHPQYLGFIMVAAGLLLFWTTAINLFLFPSLVAIYFLQARREDRDLKENFGPEYEKYKKNTPAFLPKFFKPINSLSK